MTVLTRIGELFNATSWFPLIKWPFWTLIVILAVCGVYTARFGKKKLLCLAVQGSLKLALIYMVAAVCYYLFPNEMANFSELPFLLVSEETLALANPLSMLSNWDTTLPYVIVRLYFLLFFINMISKFDYNTSHVLSWFLAQVVTVAAGFGLYCVVFFFILSFWPGNPYLFYKIVAVTLIACFTLVFVFKFVYTFIRKKDGNNTFQGIYLFLTTKSFGMVFTVSVLSFLIVIGYLVIAALFGQNVLELSSFNAIAFAINGFLTTVTLYFFNRFFNG